MVVKKREAFKDVDLGGRKWRIGRFDAMTGSYITMLVLMQMLPMGMDEQIGVGSIGKGRSLMDKKTFFDVQADCLKICSELQQVGESVAPIPVMLDDGRWGVGGIEDDMPTILALTIQTLIFNISDFFQEGALNDLTKTFSGLSQSNAKE
jgi:hypothetical protein